MSHKKQEATLSRIHIPAYCRRPMSRSTLADFEVQTRLGAGSFGTVYKVQRKVDVKLYVMKVVRIGELSHRERTDAINEVQILAQLKSPYVVCYYDSFIEKESLHIGTSCSSCHDLI